VNRVSWLACGTALLFLHSSLLLAQHHGSHGNGAAGGLPPSSVSKPDDLSDFKKALALQATPDQFEQFQRLTQSTQAARKGAQELLQLAEKQSIGDLFRSGDLLTSTVDEAHTSSQRFMQSFSPMQKSQLKDAAKKLVRANSELRKINKSLSDHVSRSAIDSKEITADAEKLDKALSDLQITQLEIANQMGIQDTEDPQ
jgi:hypothetical protein